MIAMVLIAVIATAGFSFFGYCRQFIKNSEEGLVAINFVRETMEGLYLEPEPVLPPDSDLTGILPGANWSNSINDSADGRYQIVTVILRWD